MACLIACVSACSTVTIKPHNGPKLTSPATHEQRMHFFVAGLIGDRRINLETVCRSREPVQMQTQSRLSDMTFGLLTLGLYTPHTAKVWC